MKIVAAGVSGFIGTRLTSALRSAGHDVVTLVRRPPTDATERQWDPDAGGLDRTVLAGADAVINLCGVGIGDKRWTDSYRKLIVSSRIRPTELLAHACAEAKVPTLINASAIGYYGHRDDETLDETAPFGNDFVALLCRDWETATTAAADGGVRVVRVRSGLVLGREAGILPQLRRITALFAGGRLGSGKQYYSWISATDEINAILHLLDSEVSGSVNLTAPNPVRNSEFTRELGRALHRPTPWIVPEFALKIAVGGFSGEIVNGQRVIPRVLEESGFTFSHPTLAQALRSELKH